MSSSIDVPDYITSVKEKPIKKSSKNSRQELSPLKDPYQNIIDKAMRIVENGKKSRLESMYLESPAILDDSKWREEKLLREADPFSAEQ